MIVVKLIGGLGNQLFQYAAGLQLATKYNVPLKIDAEAFNNYKLRSIDLQNFELKFEIATEQEILSLKNPSIFNKLKNKLIPNPYKTHYKEPYFHFNPSFYSLGDNVYLQGYFQSEKYFQNIQREIHSQFTIKKEIINDVQPIANELRNKNSVSIHVRIGDYSINQNTEYHGVLSADFYRNAISMIKEQYADAEFYLFSDDIVKAKNMLADQPFEAMSGKTTKNHLQDFYLMSQCKHNIIANSSFSWWAAWLNSNPNKIVVAPKKWFNKGPQDTQDLFPASWIKID